MITLARLVPQSNLIMVEKNTEELVGQFRSYLEKADGNKRQISRKISLLSFYEEMTALKNEFRIESRIVKQGLEDFRKTAELIEQGNRKIDLLVEKNSLEPEAAPFSTEHPVLQGLLELYDTVHASLLTLQKSWEAISWFQRVRRTDKTLKSVIRGQKMTLERILALLEECGAFPMEVTGCKFDPQTMRAVGTDSRDGLEDDVVSSESRTGFTFHGETLRLADVRVNRL